MTLKKFKNKPSVKLITNKYIVFFLFFIVWMIFFDENSIINHIEFSKEIHKLKAEKEYYQEEIKKDKKFIEDMKDEEKLEKFAREEYHMKKENEEIFLIAYDTLKK
jgi:cell division protein FtsB